MSIYDRTTKMANLSAPSSIERTQLNDNDLHSKVSFELLIEDKEPNRMSMPNFAYIYTCSLTMITILGCFE